jgi:hypothetical protein
MGNVNRSVSRETGNSKHIAGGACMFGSNALEIAIGVVFVFLVVSLLCTAINELIAGMMRSRARELERGIFNLLDGTTTIAPAPPSQPAEAAAQPAPGKPDPSWARRFFAHPLINALSKDNQCPSYVPSVTFVTVLKHLVSESNPHRQTLETPVFSRPLSGLSSFDQTRKAIEGIQDNTELRRALLALVEEARSDVTPGVSDTAKFDARVQVWYDHAMERVGGWYKRKTQRTLTIIAVCIVFVGNIDAIAIFRSLATDSTLRASIVAAAESYAKRNPAPTTRDALHEGGPPAGDGRAGSQPPDLSTSISKVQQSVTQLDNLGIPIGWIPWKAGHAQSLGYEQAALDSTRDAASLQKRIQVTRDPETCSELQGQYARILRDADEARARATESRAIEDRSPRGDNLWDLFLVILPQSPWVFITKIGGLLVTAAAASLGAPFWFDLLNRFISIRSTGKAPEEKPKDPKKVLQPVSP